MKNGLQVFMHVTHGHRSVRYMHEYIFRIGGSII